MKHDEAESHRVRNVAMDTIKETSRFLTHWVCSWNHQDWFVALAMTVVIGALMLRGFGSRSNY